MNRLVRPRPRLDLIESESAYELFAEVPEELSQAVEVDFKAGILNVDVQLGAAKAASNRLVPSATGTPRLWRISVGFGDLVSGERIRAVHSKGVLHVHLPKTERSELHRKPS